MLLSGLAPFEELEASWHEGGRDADYGKCQISAYAARANYARRVLRLRPLITVACAVALAPALDGCGSPSPALKPASSSYVLTGSCPTAAELDAYTHVGLSQMQVADSDCTYYAWQGSSAPADVGILVLNLTHDERHDTVADERLKQRGIGAISEVKGLGEGAFEIAYPTVCHLTFGVESRVYTVSVLTRSTVPRTPCSIARDTAIGLTR